jgi:hypothetical protein
MDRFVTRAEAYPILKVVAKPDVVTYEHVSESAIGVPFTEPIRKLSSLGHSPGTHLEEFAPLNQTQLRTLDDIENILAEAFREVNMSSQRRDQNSYSSRTIVNVSNHDTKVKPVPVKGNITTPAINYDDVRRDPEREPTPIKGKSQINYEGLYNDEGA